MDFEFAGCEKQKGKC